MHCRNVQLLAIQYFPETISAAPKTEANLQKYSYFESWCTAFPVFRRSLSLELSLCNFTSSSVTSGSDHCRSHQSWEEVWAPLSTTDPGTSCSNPAGDEIKLLGGWWQSRPRVKSWYPLKIISKVCGGGATPKRRRFSGVPVFLHLHISFPLRMKNHFHIHIIFLQGHLASLWHSIVR